MLSLQLCAENDVLLPHLGLQRNATRRILHIGVERLAAGTNTSPELLCISVLGESFLYRMVRYIVTGLLLQNVCFLCLGCLVVTCLILSFFGAPWTGRKSAKKRDNPMSIYPILSLYTASMESSSSFCTHVSPPKFLRNSKPRSSNGLKFPQRSEVFALVLAGRHRATAQSFGQLLQPSRRKRGAKRALGLRPAPAHGLQLAEVQLTQAMKPKVASKRWRPCQGRKTPKIHPLDVEEQVVSSI